MRNLLLGLALLLGVEATAQACACVGSGDDQQKREWARQIALDAVAVAEVEQVEEMDLGAMRPERYRVHRILAGEAPATFLLYRRFQKSPGGVVDVPMDDCDASPGSGERRIVVLYDPKRHEVNLQYHSAEERAVIPRGDLDMMSMCERLFLDQDGGLDLVLEEARKLGKAVD